MVFSEENHISGGFFDLLVGLSVNPPSGPGCILKVKLDGFRTLLRLDRGPDHWGPRVAEDNEGRPIAYFGKAEGRRGSALCAEACKCTGSGETKVNAVTQECSANVLIASLRSSANSNPAR
jgi:hypothetical protein